MAALHPRRGKVSPEQERCLQINAEFLTEELDSPEIVPKLRSKFILNRDDEEKILGSGHVRHPRKEQNKQLLDIIMMRRPQGFEAFLEALEVTGHDKAAMQLRDTLTELKMNTTHGASQTKTVTNNSTVAEEKKRSTNVAQAYSGVEAAASNANSADPVEKQKQEDLPDDQSDPVGHLTQRVDNIDDRLCVVETREQTVELIRLQQELEDARAEQESLVKENSDLSLSIKELQGRNLELQERVDEMTSLLKSKSDQLEKANQKIGNLEKRIKEIDNDRKTLRNNVVKLDLQVTEANSAINAMKQAAAKQKDQHDKDLTKLRTENLRDRRALEDYKKGVESRFQAMEQMMKAGAPPKPAQQNNRHNFPPIAQKDNRLKKRR